MNGIEEYQNHFRQQSLATLASAEELAKQFWAIAVARADNAKGSFKEGAAFLQRLAGAKSLEQALEIRTEYTRTAHETFVAESKGIVELYNELSKIARKPFGVMISNAFSQTTDE
jgi:hypothetical protein